jgi:hypothetical protein
MPANYVLLEKITVGAAGAASVTFSGIPQTGYTDLVIKYTARSTAPDSGGSTPIDVRLTFNGSSSGYSERMLYGTGSAAASAATSGSFLNWAGTQTNASQTASTFASSEIYIPNYTSANNKSMSIDAVQENNATASAARLVASLWANSAAITSLTLTPDYGNFAQYSTFYLYGVAKLGTTPVIVPYATGGDTIMTDGTYWYHTFISSGTFTPQKAITCDYLVVAGGGSGGSGGGGGAGGLRSTVTATGGGGSLESALSLGTSAYTVTIGAGGASIGAANSIGNAGSNSVFSTITSTGGGAGAAYGGNGGNGGSGGGGSSQTQNAGTGTANQGYAGAKGFSGTYYQGGGGGGANGTPAQPGDTGAGGVGGSGVSTSISGSSVTYAGGAGGAGQLTIGTGGSGGGGNGGAYNTTTNATAGTANRGGGGGGSYAGLAINAAAGGSGIVIVRYLV